MDSLTKALVSFLMLVSVPTVVPAAEPSAKKPSFNDGQAVSVSIENDSNRIGGPGVDQAFSNGLKLSYVYARDQIPKWAPAPITNSAFLKDELKISKVNFGVSLNHQIYTPNNTNDSRLLRRDRPYAAWLNLAFSIQLKNKHRAQTLDASFGVIGPAALGEQVQNGFHRFVGTSTAQGWSHQLGDEPAVQLSYQQRIQFVQLRNASGTYFDLIPVVGVGFGNVLIGIHSGMIARIGWNIPDDFGPARPSASETDSFVEATPIGGKTSKPSFYFFAGARGNGVARNIFLDGNTIRPSHRVTKYPVTAETEIGFGIQVSPVNLVWRYIVRSPEFEENSGFNSFASVGITFSSE